MTRRIRAFVQPGPSARTAGLAFVSVSIWLTIACATARADDWPTYRHDTARSGVTAEQPKLPLTQSWVFQPRRAPQPAWSDPKPVPVEGILELPRVHFDDAFHVAVAGGGVFFGSSADNNVYCLDAATGKIRWSFRTGGPVRLAPTVRGGRVYVGSDDGFAYCLQAADGREVWKFAAAPGPRKLLGHGKMISRWPVRSGVLVDDGVAYFTAGIFPAEGVYVYAAGAENGKLVWCNDTGGAAPQSRVSPQGYLLASKEVLFAPMGRVSPAAFSRKDGRLVHETYFGKRIGGTYALLAEDQLVTGTEELLAYKPKSPKAQLAWFGGRQLILTPKVSYLATDRQITALDRTKYPKISLQRRSTLRRLAGLANGFRMARQAQRKAEPAIRQHQQALKAIDKQIEALAGKSGAGEEPAALKTRRTYVNRELQSATKSLAAAKKRLADLQKQQKSLKDKLKQAEAGMAASVKWRRKVSCPDALILAGKVLFAGGRGKVAAIDAAGGEELWTHPVTGKAKGLAVADGRLFVSTDRGWIYCFGPAGSQQIGTVRQETAPSPYPRDDLTAVFEAAAKRIVAATGIKRGHCLVLGSGTGRLACELAQRTELRICGVEPDPRKVEAAQKALDAAGLHGTRVTVEQAPLSRVPYADYFANLIVSETALISGEPPDAKEALRMLKPLGGVICIGQPAEAKGRTKPLSAEALRRWAAAAGMKAARVPAGGGLWLQFTRGPLAGAGSWTHQYANPANTTCGDDRLVRSPLGLLWFGNPGPGKMVNRHSRAAAPLSIDGRMFVQGENLVMAYDAYNGLKLWERKIPGAMRTAVSHQAGNLAANGDSLFLAIGSQCLRLSAADGRTQATYKAPPAKDGKPRRWEYLACAGGLLYGGAGVSSRACDRLFAISLADGRICWKYEAKRVVPSAIAIGDGQVLLADMEVTPEQRRDVLEDKMSAAARLKGTERLLAEEKLKAAEVRLVTALDAATGRKRWQRPVDLTGCGRSAFWCSLANIYHKGVVVFFGVYRDGHHWRQFFAGQFRHRRVVALSAKNGDQLWAKDIGYRVRPLVIGDTLHAEPWAFDLRTGKQRTRIHPVTGRKEIWQFARPGHHCGCPAASPNALFFRSFCIGYYDLAGDAGTMHFGAQRPGCWINFIPANGLLLIPEASSGCMCPFPNMCTIVLQPVKENRAWAYYSAAGAMTPVKRLALNLGAPGDRKDPAGGLWLGYPRPSGSLVLRFGVEVSMFPGGGYFKHDPARLRIDGTDKPWVFRSGVRGLRRCAIPLMGLGDGTARYTVRLAFAEVGPNAPASRVFGIKIQDKVVAESFDVVKAAGGPGRAVVREFRGIDVAEKLKVELVPKARKPTKQQWPVLQGVEVVREKVLTLGLTAASFLLNDAQPRQGGEVRIANHKDEAFSGVLRVEAPEGFTVTPAQSPVKLASDEKAKVTLTAAVVKKQPRGTYPVAVKLVRPDGQVECERQAQIEYLAERSRVVLKAAQDAYVSQAAPTVNRGTTGTLVVDGGDKKMGDHSHHVAYLRFRLKVPGRPVSARLRLYNAGNPSGSAGRICLVTKPWSERKITYKTRPKAGEELGKIGRVAERQVVTVPLKLTLAGRNELSLVIDPTSCDGVDYVAREGGKPAELIVEYEK